MNKQLWRKFINSLHRRRWALLFFAAALPYLTSISGDFVFDDIPLLRDDPFYQTENNPLNCWRRSFWTEDRRQGLYRPVTTFSYWLGAKLHGLRSPGFRVGNLLLHTIATVLVYLLARRLRAGATAALLAGLFFAVHPLHTEAVIPAFGRAELLCAVFMLGAILFHLQLRERLSLFHVCGAALCFTLACWSKENGAAFLPLCILLDLTAAMSEKTPAGNSLPLSRISRARRRFAPYLGYAVALLLVVGMRVAVLGTVIPAKSRFVPAIDNRLGLVSTPIRVVSAWRIQGMALGKFLWPKTLSHDYSYAQLMPSEKIFDPLAWLTLGLFIALPMIFYLRSSQRWRSLILFLPLAYILSILPAGNFIIVAGTIFAERLLYFPSVWLCIAAGILLARLPLRGGKRIFACALVGILLLACGIRSAVRGLDWLDQQHLALAGIRSAPRSIKSWNDLAVALEKIKDLEGAVAACSQAIEIYPDYPTALANRGTYQAQLGKIKAAEKDLRRAIELNPGMINARLNLGALLANTGRKTEAITVWQSLAQDHPQTKGLKPQLERLIREVQTEQ